MKILLTYRSKSGFTKKYADMISQQLHIKAYPQKEVSVKMMMDYDMIIHGGGLYIGGINGAKYIQKNMHQLSDKHIIIFGVGATPPRQSDIDYVVTKNFTKEEQEKIHFFYMRGGFHFNKCTFTDKVLMTLLRLKLTLKRNKTGDERGMLNAYSKPLDLTNKKNIEPLINLVGMIRKEENI